MIFFAGLHSSLTQVSVRPATLLVIAPFFNTCQKVCYGLFPIWSSHCTRLMLGSRPRSVTAQGVVSSVPLTQRWEDFRVYAQVNAMSLFLYGGIQAFLFRVTESVISSETKHFENCITRSRHKQGTTVLKTGTTYTTINIPSIMCRGNLTRYWVFPQCLNLRLVGCRVDHLNSNDKLSL